MPSVKYSAYINRYSAYQFLDDMLIRRFPADIGPGQQIRACGPATCRDGDLRERRPILDLLEEAVARLCAVETDDTAAMLQAAWEGFVTAGAAGGLLALYGDPSDRLRWHTASPALVCAIDVLQDAPSLPAHLPLQLDPAEGHGHHLDPATAARIRQGIAAMTLALATILPWTAQDAPHLGDARACRIGASLATEISDCYRTPIPPLTS